MLSFASADGMPIEPAAWKCSSSAAATCKSEDLTRASNRDRQQNFTWFMGLDLDSLDWKDGRRKGAAPMKEGQHGRRATTNASSRKEKPKEESPKREIYNCLTREKLWR